MLQWLQLTTLLLLIVTTSGREIECDSVVYEKYCWNSQALDVVDCWSCFLVKQHITKNDEILTISPKLANGTDVDVEHVSFFGGDIFKMPRVIQNTTNQQISQVALWSTSTRVLNAQYFENAAEELKHLWSYWSNDLFVEASTFQNCAKLENLNLRGHFFSRNFSIAPDAFLGLHKLIRLDLSGNELALINENWFFDLANLEVLNLNVSQLEEIPDTAFDNLRKLKKLYLDENKIEMVTRRMFHNNKQLQLIHLDENQIKVIQSGTFAQFNKLTELILSGNICIDETFLNKSSEEISAGLTACLPTLCVVPVISNGYVISTKDNVTQTTGESLEKFRAVKVVCNPNFLLFHEKETQRISICTKDDWTSQEWPKCERE